MKKIAVILASLVIAMPFAASALGEGDLASQIAALLAKITDLQAQILSLKAQADASSGASVASSTVFSTPSGADAAASPGQALPNAARVCPIFNLTLSRGASGTAVTALQQFLLSRNFLTADSVTGYYGPITESAVRALQAQQGVVSAGDAASTGWGVVGKQTGALITRLCADASAVNTAPSTALTPGAGISCMPLLPPSAPCAAGWQPVSDGKGCIASYRCETTVIITDPTPAVCPIYNRPLCADTESLQTKTDANGCSVPYCAPSTGSATVSVSANSSTITPQGSVIFSWSAQNAPSGAIVQLDLVDAGTKQVVGDGVVCSKSSIPGSCSWTVPALDNSPLGYCGRATDMAGICGSDLKVGNSYMVRARLQSAFACRGFCPPPVAVQLYATSYSSPFTLVQKLTTCPLYNAPLCKSGETLKMRTDANGCSVPYCDSGITMCPVYQAPYCGAGEAVSCPTVDALNACPGPCTCVKTCSGDSCFTQTISAANASSLASALAALQTALERFLGR